MARGRLPAYPTNIFVCFRVGLLAARVGTVEDKVATDYTQWHSSRTLADMRVGVAQRRPVSTIKPAVLGWKPALCHWSRQNGGFRLAVEGQNH